MVFGCIPRLVRCYVVVKYVECFLFFVQTLPQQAKRFIGELNRMAEHNASSLFSVQQLKDLAKVLQQE